MKIIKTALFVSILVLGSCNNALEEETFSVLGPSNFYNTGEDAETLLNGVYSRSQGYRDILRDYLTFNEMTTDIMIERGGAINSNTQPVEDFLFPSTQPWLLALWNRSYSAIYRSNVILEKVPGIDMDEDRKAQVLAEARFLRVFNYHLLYGLFGRVPIVTSSETSIKDRPSRAGEEEMTNFLETEFLAVAAVLPVSAEQFGRATKGAALGFLCKFYLNQKRWAEAAAMAQQVMGLGAYALFTEGSREQLFAMENERNSEFIFSADFPDTPTGSDGNTYLTHAAPPGYLFKFPPKNNFAAQFKIRSEFLDLFEPGDERLNAFVFEYTNVQGATVVLGLNDVRSFKYMEDPNGIADVAGNDFPWLRYADILLSRAEALNEVGGPTQESIDLVNEIREAAGVPLIDLASNADKAALRDFILDERGREFHTETLRREDLIRHGKFIEMAVARGKPAKDFHVLFPIPQSELDKNPNLEQNPGY